jgi:hypothetical protein
MKVFGGPRFNTVEIIACFGLGFVVWLGSGNPASLRTNPAGTAGQLTGSVLVFVIFLLLAKLIWMAISRLISSFKR